MYSDGIISDASGCGNTLTHAVTCVGYGHSPEFNMDYYIVRNSWGANWGSKGGFVFI